MAQDSHHLDRTLQSATRSRDRAVTRVRRLTAAIGLTAVLAASGLGVLIASEPVAVASTTTTTGTGSAGTTSTSVASSTSGTSDTSTTGSSGVAVTSPTTTTPATTVSGQS
jgi:hypothetical protein